MDRIKQIWIEASRSSSFDSSAMHNRDHPHRPPPLRTSSTYDDDEVFNKTGLSLLSRYETLGLSAQEVLLATLISPKQRASFLEGLSVRLDQSIVHNNFQLLQALEKTFGKDLQDLVVAESKANEGHFYSTNPMAPRHTTASRAAGMASTQTDDEDDDAASEAVPQPTREDQNIPMSNSSMSSGSTSDRPHHSSTQAQGTKKKSTPRRFFPDTDMGSFFRSKRRVQNIDWKMAEAVKQVEHLQLDGMTTSPGAIQGNNKNSGGGGGSYEPPITE